MSPADAHEALVAEHEARTAAGEEWCRICLEWHAVETFASDRRQAAAGRSWSRGRAQAEGSSLAGPGRTPQPAIDEVPACNSSVAAEIAGITYKQLDHWTRLGHLHPGGGSGTGNSRWWADDEVEVARRMGRLTSAGLPLAWSAQFARNGWPAGEIAPGILVSVTP